MITQLKNGFILLVFLVLAVACQEEITITVDENGLEFNDTDFIPEDWTAETHSKETELNYEEVFDSNAVKRLDIKVSDKRWQLLMNNMKELYGSFGAQSSGGGMPGFGGPPPGGAGGLVETEDPIFVPADLEYKGKTWYRIGIRFKGNSSLQSTWSAGNMKLSLKLDFDEFEEEYPQILDQRFYGFKQFSLKNNYDDKSFIREKVSADIFRKAGLAVSNTAFYTLYIDYGDGPVYFGLYTLVEEVDDTVIKTQFKNNNGNLYKPENSGSTFKNGTFNESDFAKKTNEDLADWSDIKQLFTALNNSSRTENPTLWRTELEQIFDTDVFLKYLAVNTIIQNWDTYGRMTHNFYLYNNPKNGKLTWIPWDNNEALQEGKMGGALNLDFSDLSVNSWPLIEYLYSDAVYKAKYDSYLQEVISSDFVPAQMKTIYESYTTLISSYATSEKDGYSFLNNTTEFTSAINSLKTHVDSRNSAVHSYLDRQ